MAPNFKVAPTYNKKLADATGNFTTTDPLVSFFYTLLRDKLPAGVVEQIVREVEAEGWAPKRWFSVELTNGHVAQYAELVADRLRTLERVNKETPCRSRKKKRRTPKT